jgi:hypothetical protein
MRGRLPDANHRHIAMEFVDHRIRTMVELVALKL